MDSQQQPLRFFLRRPPAINQDNLQLDHTATIESHTNQINGIEGQLAQIIEALLLLKIDSGKIRKDTGRIIKGIN